VWAKIRRLGKEGDIFIYKKGAIYGGENKGGRRLKSRDSCVFFFSTPRRKRER